jgi:hypothetical protein
MSVASQISSLMHMRTALLPPPPKRFRDTVARTQMEFHRTFQTVVLADLCVALWRVYSHIISSLLRIRKVWGILATIQLISFTIGRCTYLRCLKPFLRSCQLCSHSGTPQHFKEPEGSLPCSQEPSTGPYPEPDRSSSYHSISLRSILIMSTHLRLGIPSGLFPSGFPTNIVYVFLLFPFVLHALPISSSLDHSNYTWWRVQIVKLILQYFPTSCHFISLRFKYSPQHPVLKGAGIAQSV